jgi:hypothetical protein
LTASQIGSAATLRIKVPSADATRISITGFSPLVDAAHPSKNNSQAEREMTRSSKHGTASPTCRAIAPTVCER